MSSFSGFPQDGINFLKELAENNERGWFEANKNRYQDNVLHPATEFITAVGEKLQTIVPNIRYDTRTNGSGSLMRIYRDTRFSKDKTPYKTNISAMWWEGAGKKTASPAFGFQMDATGMGLMAGMFGFDKEQLAQYRETVNDVTQGNILAQIINDLTADGTYEVLGEKYKKVPRGFDPEHPHAELLKFKGLYAHPKASISAEQLTQTKLVEICSQQLIRMAPLQQWLAAHLL